MPSVVAPVLNPMKLAIREPMEVVPGFVIRRATTEEIQTIRELIHQHCPYPSEIALAQYEARKVTIPMDGGGHQHKYVDAPISEWRYNVITVSENYLVKIGELEQISNVSSVQF